MPDALFLSKFTPLPRIFFADDFDEGANGWCELIGNHDGDLNKVRKVMEDLRPPQLSSANFFDIGSHGSLSGTYSLKLATRAKAGHMAQTIKRTTSRGDGRVRVECYFTYKAEQIFGAATNWDQQRHLRGRRREALPHRAALPEHRQDGRAGAALDVQDLGAAEHEDGDVQDGAAELRLSRRPRGRLAAGARRTPAVLLQ
jgi:hypothetical protein